VSGLKTDTKSEYVLVGGPIKGSYVIKNGEDVTYDYISDFGVRVEDPCQAVDNKQNMFLSPGYSTSKDFRYHVGTDSQFWLQKIC